MRRALPSNAKLSKEVKDLMMACATEFISFTTREGKSYPSTGLAFSLTASEGKIYPGRRKENADR
jgi:hypothetical protein